VDQTTSLLAGAAVLVVAMALVFWRWRRRASGGGVIRRVAPGVLSQRWLAEQGRGDDR
jgi:hypothetical protein